MNKKYEYNGNIYCEDDLSEEIYNYGGDLDDLFFDLLRNKDIEETTYYSAKDACSSDEYYEDYKELIKEEYEKLGIEVFKAMNKYKEALNTIVDAIRDYVSYREFDLLPSENEIYGAMALLRKLVNKADSFEWIPVSKKLPDEHDSIFAKLYETDVVNDMLWRTRSKEVLVTIEYENGERTVKSSHTTDGKWWIEKGTTLSKFKVIAWMPMPEPYKENEND